MNFVTHKTKNMMTCILYLFSFSLISYRCCNFESWFPSLAMIDGILHEEGAEEGDAVGFLRPKNLYRLMVVDVIDIR